VIKTTALLRLPERLTLPMAALSAAGLLLCAALAGEQIDSLVNSQLSQQLSTDQRALKGWLAQQTQGLRQSAHWMAQQPQWQQALDGTPAADMQATLDAAAKASGMQWAVLIDQTGKLLSQPTDRVRALLQAHETPLAEHLASAGELTLRHAHQTERIWVQPVGGAASGTHGAILIGQPLNNAWVSSLRPMVRSTVVLLERDRHDGPWEAAPGAPAGTPAGDQWPSKAGPSSDGQVRNLPLPTQTALFSAMAVSPEDKRPLSALALLASPDDAKAPWLDMAELSALVLGTSLALGSLVTWLVGWRVRRGLQALNKWAAASVELEYPAPPASKAAGELDRLVNSLDKLRKHYRLREADTRQMAFKDPLTLLPNREQFRLKLKAIVTHLKTSGRGGAVIVLDLQRFKYVNEVLGYANGDRLLRLVAQRVGDQLTGKHDVLARTGGNAFTCVVPMLDPPAAALKAQALLACFDEPFFLDEQAIDLRANAGLTLFPQHGEDSNVLISRAELAMFSARRRQADWLTYDATMDAANPASLSLLSDLKLAIERNELMLYLQPKADLQTGQITGAEALMRWKHPTRGMVPPDRFIPFAEQSGFIRTLSLWAVEEAARLWRQLHDEGMDIKVSVNLSTRDLIDKDLPAKLDKLVNKHRAHHEGLVLEITESATMDDPEHAHRTLAQLHELGFLLSIDDFGTGYSSLAYLKDLPVDELKIDRSFVMNMESNLDDAKIVRSTIDLAHNLGLKVVAEGIESNKTWKILAGLNCDVAQGYLISRPLPAHEFITWVRQWTPPSVADEALSTAFADIL
jgi:diguanylate cyclase (GGDEF)-like protein